MVSRPVPRTHDTHALGALQFLPLFMQLSYQEYGRGSSYILASEPTGIATAHDDLKCDAFDPQGRDAAQRFPSHQIVSEHLCAVHYFAPPAIDHAQ